MPQVRRARKRAAEAVAARLLAASADAADTSAASVAGSSSSAAVPAPTSSCISGPDASFKGGIDVAKVLTIIFGVLPHSDKVRGLMGEVFTTEEILDSDSFLDAGIRDLLVWTLAALEFYEIVPPLTHDFLLAQQSPPTASPVGEKKSSRPLHDIVRDLVELCPHPQFLEHGVQICRTSNDLSPEVHGAT